MSLGLFLDKTGPFIGGIPSLSSCFNSSKHSCANSEQLWTLTSALQAIEEITQSSSTQAKVWLQAHISEDFECFINFAFEDVVLGLQRR